jgi:hypothetical protein
MGYIVAYQRLHNDGIYFMQFLYYEHYNLYLRCLKSCAALFPYG